MLTELLPHSAAAHAFEQYLRHGIGGLNRSERIDLQSLFVTDPRMNSTPAFHAALGNDFAIGGGYAVPEEVMPEIVEAMKSTGGVRQVATVLSTRTGAVLPIATDNDTDVPGEIISENNVHNDGDITFGQVVLESFLYSSKIVKVSRQLLQDYHGNITAYLGRKLGMRLGRIQNTNFTTADGVSKPHGIVTASTLGKTAAGATAITYDELADLMYSVDPDYQSTGTWMMNLDTLGIVRKLKDSSNNPVWAALSSGIPNAILGRPVQLNQDMSSPASGVRSILYGDLSAYYVRDAGNVIVVRLDERYADRLQVAFLAFLRSDGDLVDAGTHPVKHLAHP